MPFKRQRGESWEYVIKRAGVLDKPLTLTFKTEEEGDTYCRRLEALLDRGIVPAEYQSTQRVLTVGSLIDRYEREAPVGPKDRAVLRTVAAGVGTARLDQITANWVDEWISDLKRVDRLAPATIRSKVGALARACDWGMRKGLLVMPDHPLRTLPDGYAQYTETDAALAGGRKADVERDRRLEPGEHERILATIAGGVLPRKQRPYTIAHLPAVRCLYLLALESAMRLRECFTLTLDQVDLARRTVFLDKTKNGDKRQVPLSTPAVAALTEYLNARADCDGTRLFPWLRGEATERALGRASDFLSKLYGGEGGIFEVAGCNDLNFHDLRHEATSRLFEKTSLSETEVMKITGHKTHRMMMRYANLRASDLAARLW